MDRSKLKAYAPKARRDFIRAMTDRAAIYGLTENKIEPVTEKGDVAIIAGKAYPIPVAAKRRALEDRIKRHGFEQTMEAMAYTWFNRFAAIRFMELHGYLDHGYRVLSHPDGNSAPEIVEHAEHVDMPGLDKNKVIDLKLDGTKEGELYRMLLIAQCNALHSAMPFLFEEIDDETELLLPDNLLHSDSLIRQLVNEIDAADWQPVEIIGWLYQFYISEKKDQVIGTIVKSEELPAATQLFTPNWIVKYKVQNSLGQKWLATYPNSPLRQQMEYYIEPAEQTPEVQAQLKAITSTELNPEELTLMDPACGSGHILVEGYDVFKAIYQERGYRAKDIPRLILERNLFGLEIDDRAAQLAAFALMMKARADDRRIFESEAKPNILAFQDSQGMNPAEITHALNSPINKEEIPSTEYLFEEIEDEKTPLFSEKAPAEKGHVSQSDIACLLALFENAKTFGSLIQLPPKLVAKLPEIEQRLNAVLQHGDLTHTPANVIKPLLQQAQLLARQYDAVAANPPYMGARYMPTALRKFAEDNYSDTKTDLFAMFIERCLALTTNNGHVAMITMHGWMFISSYDALRERLLSQRTILGLAHLGARAFGSISGEVVQTATFSLLAGSLPGYRPTFFRLIDGDEDEKRIALLAQSNRYNSASQQDFAKIPGRPIAYWLSPALFNAFETNPPLGSWADVKEGLNTGDNDQFLRFWTEVNCSRIGFACGSTEDARRSGKRWFPCNKGGSFRKWSGNNDYVINWEDDGRDIRSFRDPRTGRLLSAIRNTGFYFRPGLTWSGVGTGGISVRAFPKGFVFNSVGRSLFPHGNALYALGFLNSVVCSKMLTVLSPSIHFAVGDIAALPINRPTCPETIPKIEEAVSEMVRIATDDWNCSEFSWEFDRCPIVPHAEGVSTIAEAIQALHGMQLQRIQRMTVLEEATNRLFIDIYGLQNELLPEVSEDQITLTHLDLEEDIKRIFSYAIGCMMGRYSLDKPGLIYAHSGNTGFDLAQYKTFVADQDGIIPLTETAWFDDDAANRVIEFIGVAWPKEHLEENLRFIAESLGSNKGEQPRDTIRRYLATDFFKHHLSMYKKRPIYWLFSSGKQRAFQCVVYLHRYNEGTLSRMRTEYVIPLQGKVSARIDQLAGDIAAATSTAFRSKLTKERDKLVKQQAELQAFDEKLRHYADLRISLDLDDGVKVNYGKFGDLLAEVKAVTGGIEE